jgi:hypothetical protein
MSDSKTVKGSYFSLFNFLSSFNDQERRNGTWTYMVKKNTDIIRRELFGGEKGEEFVNSVNAYYTYANQKDEIRKKYMVIEKDEKTGKDRKVFKDEDKLKEEMEKFEADSKEMLDKYKVMMNEPFESKTPLYAVLPQNAPDFEQRDMDFLVEMGVVRDDI